MKLLLKMAWLNSWRNKRRTAVLLCAMIVGLVGVLFTAAFMEGWLNEMVDTAIRGAGGHVKIMREAYHRNPIVEHAMPAGAPMLDALRDDPRVRSVRPRVSVGALLSNARHSRAVQVVAVDPAVESPATLFAAGAALQGSFLDGEDPLGVAVGRRLADKMEVEPGDKLVMMSQHADGDLASSALRVEGIYDDGGAAESVVYIRLSHGREVLGLQGRVTDVAVRLHDRSDSAAVAAMLNAQAGESGAVALTWQEVMPFVAEVLDMSRQMTAPVLSVFYIAMAFGILNTLLIAIGERAYETGVMLSVGMRPRQVVVLIVAEALCQAVVASLAGAILGWGLVELFAARGIDLGAFAEGMQYAGVGQVIYPAMNKTHLGWGMAATLGVALAASAVPAVRAARTIPVEAMRRTR